VVTADGIGAVTFMMVVYALGRRGRRFILWFAVAVGSPGVRLCRERVALWRGGGRLDVRGVAAFSSCRIDDVSHAIHRRSVLIR
jgi:hypothetical protein